MKDPERFSEPWAMPEQLLATTEMLMRVYIYVDAYIYIYISIYACIYTYGHRNTCKCMCVHVYACIYRLSTCISR